MRKVKVSVSKVGAAGNQKAAPFNNYYDNGNQGTPNISVGSTLHPVDWSQANLEAERGENVVTDMSGDGIPENYTVGGKRHYEGGTPLNLPSNSFIFSRDKAMKIKDEDILKMFGKSGKKAMTPAQIAKQYDLNEYKKTLLDKDADKRQKSTAEMMIANYNDKLAKLALTQESKKGFPNGIPFIAQPYLETMSLNPADLLTTQAQPMQPDADQMQMGGQKKKSVDTYDANESKFLKALFPNVALPMDVVEATQGAKSGSYGRFEKTSADKNWSWYGKPVDWKNKQSVEAAQNAYNTELISRFTKAGYSPQEASYFVDRIGFVGDTNRPNSVDGKAGKYTETRVMPDIPAKKVQSPVASSTTTGNPPADVPVHHFENPQYGEVPADFWLQDKIKMAGAYGDMGRIKKYMPWQATFNPTLATPTFYDSTRELAANAEQSNIASQAAAMFSGPQALNARLNQIQGQGAANAANILGRYNNQNVSVANQFEQTNADTMNRYGQMRADQATQLYDKNTMANQNFDNAKAMARQNLRQSFIDSLTNRGKTQAMNSLYSQYAVNPNTGGTTYFKNPRALNPEKPENHDIMERAQYYLNKYPSFDAKTAFDAAKVDYGIK